MQRREVTWLQECDGGWKVKMATSSSSPFSGGRSDPIWFNSIFEFCQKMIHSIFDSILLYQGFNSKYYSIFWKNLLIQFKRWLNSIVRESWILVEKEKGPKIAQKVSKIDKKRGLFIKNGKYRSKHDSFIHYTTKFNLNDYSISIFWEYSIQKIIQQSFFPDNSIKKLIQNL